ncbi:hypothetical protein [Clostridium oryzae]|uniref:Uncharacterized protein n=1 Tax=Clostridium oryzae TaxID=1450648 RepID=A0A1V4I6U2_9CLOT|nr:hypothetical protein [Clostridium oryzae]OPJ55691.1 hypothetical protein CLORY_43910 [Clostridium oryzae]
MSQYRLNIYGDVYLEDYSEINDYIELIEPGDKFLVTFDNVNKNNMDIILTMLKEKRCTILSTKEEQDRKIVLGFIKKYN